MIRAVFARARHAAGRLARIVTPFRPGLSVGLAILLLCHLGPVARIAHSAEIFVLAPEEGPALIFVKGALTSGDAVKFAKRVEKVKDAVVTFESSGGMVIAGVAIGRTIRRKGFHTSVPSMAQCLSACGLAWLGGTKRFMAEDARIGFHAAYILRGGRPRRSRAAEQLVGDYLRHLALPRRAIAYVTRSPPEHMYVLTMARARSLGVDVSPYQPEEITGSVDKASAAAAALKRLPQIDLYGVNLPGMPIETGSADECEAQCIGNEACAAFTFNAARSACFLKSSAEIAVSHPAVTSGYRGRKRIRRIALTIQEATDYPGNDIERRKATNFESCLLACGKARSCKAFTYVIQRHECWLKNGIGSAEARDGFVSGVK